MDPCVATMLLDKPLKVFVLNVNDLDPGWERFILAVGNAREICNIANNKRIPWNCLVTDKTGNIMWHWIDPLHQWKPNNNSS